MISVISIYQDCARDDANESENGLLSYAQFNRNLRRSEMNVMRFLTGDIMPTADMPIPFSTQKNKDYLKRFIATKTFNNKIAIPDDYFMWDNLYLVSKKAKSECEGEEEKESESCNVQIPILDGGKFYNRCHSYIKGLRPSAQSPIAKIVNNEIIVEPSDVGTIKLEYIRYPKFGEIKTTLDTQFNDVIADPLTSVNLEWDEWARELIIWFIVQKHTVKTRERSAMENNMATKPRG